MGSDYFIKAAIIHLDNETRFSQSVSLCVKSDRCLNM